MKTRSRSKPASPQASVSLFDRAINRTTKPAGSAPGTLLHTGRRKIAEVMTRRTEYDAAHLSENLQVDAAALTAPVPAPRKLWIDVTGLHDIELIEGLGQAFDLHPLMLEDILSPKQRAKVEEYDTHLFVVVKMLRLEFSTQTIEVDQLSLVLGDGYLLSFQEQPSEVFAPIHERLGKIHTRIRTRGTDYLMYTIIDSVVDSYFRLLEALGDRIESLEDKVLSEHTTEVMHQIHALKREVLVLRRAVWPIREALAALYRSESALIDEQTRIFLRDTYDHTVQVIDTIETFRDLLSGIMDLYISTVSNRMNEVMKVLTIIATIFIPLSFFAGIYGMNFENMPELKLPWAYPALLLFMVAVAGGMLWYFRRKHWF